MIFRQLFDSETSTFTYILADENSKEAIIIDSVLENNQRDYKLIKELGLKPLYFLETHVHADHITGIHELKQYFPDAKSVSHENSGALSDILIKDSEEMVFGNYKIKAIYTPGHTNGCVSYYTDNKLFTGDTLLIRGCGRTDFQEGCPSKLYNSVKEKLLTLPENTIIYPAHDYKGMTCTSVFEEKNFNPRFANKTENEFIEIMNNLNLAHPKKIHESVPANLNCGKR